MIEVADLDRLYQRNAPVAAGGKVERAIQLIRFCGSLYRDLRVSYPDVTWDRQLALEVQGLVLRARDALDLGSFAFLSGDQEPHAFGRNRAASCSPVRPPEAPNAGTSRTS